MKILKKLKEIYSDVFGQKKYDNIYLSDDSIESSPDIALIDDATLSRSVQLIRVLFLFLCFFFLWTYFFSIAEVTIGQGKVVPSSKEQVIQSLDGGILQELKVREGDEVEVGTVLAKLDSTRIFSNFQESLGKYNALLASQARLSAEVDRKELKFPDEILDKKNLIYSETNLFKSKQQALKSAVEDLNSSINLSSKELAINDHLARRGASSKIDVIKLKRQIAELQMRKNTLIDDYFVKAREELSKVSAELSSLAPVVKGRTDYIEKATIRSPVKGTVKSILTNTIGGAIPQNGSLMTITPRDDKLLIEARIKPNDIAFIHPGQIARVKITAYPYAIYGGLKGKVHVISSDSSQDESNPKVDYYKVYIQTDTDYLDGENLKNRKTKLKISPGMIASVDITTGSKTIFQYLVKPFNKVNEALRER